MALLELTGVSKSFGGVHAVSGLSFTVPEGTIVGLIGPNGSGKTTVFNLISGMLRPDRGALTLAGESLIDRRPHEICHRGIGRTFQIVQPFNSLTVMENVRVGAFRTIGDPDRAAREAGAVLDLVGLAHKRNALPTSLTIADRKRLELARALATSPQLLLLDEFMAGLNPVETASAMTLVRRLVAGGLTLLMVEHIVWALMDLSRRIIVLSAGEKIAEGPPEAIAADPAVVDVYLGSDRGAIAPGQPSC